MKTNFINNVIRCELKDSKKNPPTRHQQFPDHLHDFYEICIVLDEEIKFITDNKIHYLSPNSFIIIPPSKYHHVISKGNNYKRIILWFEIDPNNTNISFPFLEDIFAYDYSKVSPLLGLISSFEHLTKKADSKLLFPAAEGFLINLFMQINYIEPLNAKEKEHTPLLKAILDFLNANLNKKLYLNDIAEQFYISPVYLEKIFKSNMHISLMHYFREKQLLQAKSLILQGEKPTSVYLMCGFDNYTTFYKSFVKQFGCSPKNIKK